MLPGGCAGGDAGLVAGVEDRSQVERGLEGKKRKKVSEAEKIASELSKLASELSKGAGKHDRLAAIRFERNKVIFQQTKSCDMDAPKCKWSEVGLRPCYCPAADFKFEACLPDREYLTRFSVSCAQCTGQKQSAFHLYCSYCDEILTGSIAGPGGKISDHVVTIRHVVKEAKAQQKHFKGKCAASQDYLRKAQHYLSMLEHWSSTIRFKRNSEEREEIDEVFVALRAQLDIPNRTQSLQQNTDSTALHPKERELYLQRERAATQGWLQLPARPHQQAQSLPPSGRFPLHPSTALHSLQLSPS